MGSALGIATNLISDFLAPQAKKNKRVVWSIFVGLIVGSIMLVVLTAALATPISPEASSNIKIVAGPQTLGGFLMLAGVISLLLGIVLSGLQRGPKSKLIFSRSSTVAIICIGVILILASTVVYGSFSTMAFLRNPTQVPTPTLVVILQSTATIIPTGDFNTNTPTLVVDITRTAIPSLYQVINVRSNDVLNIHEEAGVRYRVIGTIPSNGRGIQIIGDNVQADNATWVPIIYNGIVGWVNSYYLARE
jgi:hypothetical protein